LGGLYTVGDEQLSDFHLDVRHGVPACTSRAHFKGIGYGHGRAVFDGRVLVERHAQGSDAQLKNDNLMLSRKAEIDTKPQLEIYADDVKCSHGTTVGQIEPEQLFYLRSRGISTEGAKRMLCRGFAGEIIDRIEPEAVREDAYRKLAAALDNEISSE
jgi:Fe-S cluster assembly protein SufD